MNESLDRLVHLLGLDWSDSQLATALHPFQLTDQLTEGSMALVFEATYSEGNAVIVKMPSPAEGLLRIECEIHYKIETLQHEAAWLETAGDHSGGGVVHLIANRTSNTLPFLVLEKLGESVSDMLEKKADLENEECLIILRDVATTLERLHAHGICHYDVKAANILRGCRGWVLIDPTTEDTHTPEYFHRSTPAGPQRDVLALGRSFLAAYLGYEGEIDIPHGYGYGIEENPKLFHCIKRMLGTTRYSIPSASHVRRLASRILAEQFNVSSPRFPIR